MGVEIFKFTGFVLNSEVLTFRAFQIQNDTVSEDSAYITLLEDGFVLEVEKVTVVAHSLIDLFFAFYLCEIELVLEFFSDVSFYKDNKGLVLEWEIL
jgi:hypothetical protein